MIDLAEVNRREQNRHRSRVIEEAYNSSEHRHYRMPRSLPPEEESFDSIPSLYDLHNQNRKGQSSTLLPVRMLITLKETPSLVSKQLNSTTATTKKATLAKVETRQARIHCTLSLTKASSRYLPPTIPNRNWLCCPKEGTLDQLQTRELSLKEEQRYSRNLSGILLKQNCVRNRLGRK